MFLSISNYLKVTAFAMSRDPKDFIKVLEIFARFLSDKENFKDSSTSREKAVLKTDKDLKIPLKLSSDAAKKLENMLSEYHSVYRSGVAAHESDVNFVYVVGQFLTIITISMNTLLIKIENHKNIDIAPYEKATQDFNNIWGKDPQSTNARSLGKKYHQTPLQYAINDLSEKISKSIDFLKGPFDTLYKKIKDIP